MFNILDGFVERAKVTMIGVMVVIAIFIVAATWLRTRSLAPTIGTLFLGAIVIYGVSNFEDLGNLVKKDVDEQKAKKPKGKVKLGAKSITIVGLWSSAVERIACATYTHARRHPMVLGQIGGWTPPFQLSPAQIAVLLVSIIVESATWRFWGARLPAAIGVALAVGIPTVAAWAVRRGRVEGRSLVRTVAGYLILFTRPVKSQVGGKPYRPQRRPLLTSTRIFVAAGDDRP